MNSTYELRSYLREEQLPHTMCPGCGGGTVLNTFAAAVDNLPLNREDLLLVSGIGCSAWIPSPNFDADTLHTTHGRAIAFATGAKATNPDQETVVISGDGDLAGIGGNHLLHAARRNVDITVVLVNNFTYGMTGGQVAPTTQRGAKTTTSPYGNPEDAIDISAIAAEAGAVYVGRQPTSRPHQLVSELQTAIETDGFSLVEVISQCPTVYGRRNEMASAPEMLEWMDEQIENGELEVGTVVDRRGERSEFVASFDDISETAVQSHRSRNVPEGASEITEGKSKGQSQSLRLRIAGVGGQGVVVAGTILGEATAWAGRNVFKTDEYSSRARGGPASADLIIQDDGISEAKIPDGAGDILVALSEDAVAGHRNVLSADGTLYVDSAVSDIPDDVTPVPFSEFAREAGNEQATNMALLGYLNERHEIVSHDYLENAIRRNVDRLLDINIAAYKRGVDAAVTS
ncbi:2-oxoglutarate/2-oxoacid ferredoxin oxidoreductase subunit beta [Halalkaliarchaeum desulfuricum]|uniref:2-oxoglutarate/2-oxoacid ferredoxin oxidoreductase subunit beta n=1 Tax=Halalkaliarchaeum desulfuricum TaxID=2055893 RepID=A0A343TLS4_9EURY|nr:thiamine pyrophosphate-dependent enzyme [Halalkaliarchaeum desulfuricum]AUX10046.1 2-oxoglutarate/2-oxoacid ferredoxin oxidoreductase subunit beta [Halalkaliarchaeum desulfuricum]